MNDQKNNKRSKGGRKPKINPCNHRYVFRLDDEDNSKFLSLFEASGVDNKAKFITSVLFSKEIKTVKKMAVKSPNKVKNILRKAAP